MWVGVLLNQFVSEISQNYKLVPTKWQREMLWFCFVSSVIIILKLQRYGLLFGRHTLTLSGRANILILSKLHKHILVIARSLELPIVHLLIPLKNNTQHIGYSKRQTRMSSYISSHVEQYKLLQKLRVTNIVNILKTFNHISNGFFFFCLFFRFEILATANGMLLKIRCCFIASCMATNDFW